jgi:Protein of unknown function (DUF1538)
MSAWLIEFLQLVLETTRDFIPIFVVLIGFHLLIIRKPINNPQKIFTGFIFVLLGIAVFLEGLDMALFPIGKLMATQLTTPAFLGINPNDKTASWQTYRWIYLFAASLGFAVALAEPSLQAIANKAEQISGGTIRAWGLRIAVGFGLGTGLALGTFRIITGTELYLYIVAGFAIAALQTLFAPKSIIGIAFDSGTVTTTMITVPLVTSLGIGLAQAIPGRNPLLDGFGLLAFASLYPIIAVLSYAQIAQWLNKRSLSSKP